MYLKKLSVFLLGLVLSITAVYAASSVPVGSYDSNDLSIAIWKDGGTLSSHSNSMANKAVVPNSWALNVTSSDGTLSFQHQRIWILFIPGDLVAMKVDFDGDGDLSDATDGVFSGNTVTFDVPTSELTSEEHLYPASVQNNVAGYTMPRDVEFYVNLTDCK